MAPRGPILVGLALAVLAGATAIALSVTSGSTSPAPPSVDAAALEPQVAEAFEQARQAVEQEPGSVVRWGHYAMLLDAHEQLPAAAVCYSAAEALDPHDFRWPYMLAQCLSEEDPDAVIAAFERARALRPDHAPIYLRLGRLYLAETAGNRELARERFEKALALDPESSLAMWGLARLAFDAGDLQTSRKLLETAATKAPEHREVHALLARVLARLGESDSAAAAQRRAEGLTGRYPIRDPERSQVHALALDSGRLLAKGQKAISLDRPDIALASLRQATAALRVMRKRHPEDAGIRLRLWHALSLQAWLLATHADARVRDAAGSLALAEELASLAPEDPHSGRVLAAAQAASGRFRQAKDTLQGAMRLALKRGDSGFLTETRPQLDAYGEGRPWHR